MIGAKSVGKESGAFNGYRSWLEIVNCTSLWLREMTLLLFFRDSPIVSFAVFLGIRRSRYKVNGHIDVAQPICAAQVAAEYDRLLDAGHEVRILIQRCDALQEIIEQALSRPSEKRFGCG